MFEVSIGTKGQMCVLQDKGQSVVSEKVTNHPSGTPYCLFLSSSYVCCLKQREFTYYLHHAESKLSGFCTPPDKFASLS